MAVKDFEMVEGILPYLEEDLCAKPTPPHGAYSFPEITVKEINATLDTTIKEDHAAKLTTFIGLASNFTEEQQVSIGFTSVSASGKTYITNEVTSYYPVDDVIYLQHVSPKAFFHTHGVLVEDLDTTLPGQRIKNLGDYVREGMSFWNNENPSDSTAKHREQEREEKTRLKETWLAIPKAMLVDLSKKILVFMDQPDDYLLNMLKPILSHDREYTRSIIAEKNKSGAQVSKVVIIKGYPSVVFLTVTTSLSDEIKNRMYLLSASTTQSKISDSLDLLAKRRYDQGFDKFLHEHAGILSLKARLEALRDLAIPGTTWKQEDLLAVTKDFKTNRSHLKPRHTRDFSRLLGLIENVSLLNFCTRERNGNNKVIVAPSDIDAGRKLYDMIAPPNELGIEPELYYFHEERLRPALEASFKVTVDRMIGDDGIECKTYNGVDMVQFRELWYNYSGSQLSDRMLDRKIQQLCMIGMIEVGTDSEDKRKKKLYATGGGTGNARTPDPQTTLEESVTTSYQPSLEEPTPQLELSDQQTQRWVISERCFDKDLVHNGNPELDLEEILGRFKGDFSQLAQHPDLEEHLRHNISAFEGVYLEKLGVDRWRGRVD